MIAARRGLIVNLGYWSAKMYLGNAIFGAAKAAADKLTADMAVELRPYDVAAISLYPGLARTESVVEASKAGGLDLSNSETPQFIGRVIAALCDDAGIMSRSGRVVVAAAAACELGVLDFGGKSPVPLDPLSLEPRPVAC